jgi:disulfide bond formation protein DsbB
VNVLTPNRWPLAALAISALMLAAAHAFQAAGYAPCHLCLRQREVYWAIIALSAIAIAANQFRPNAKQARIFLVLIGLGFLYGAGLAAFHAGVEWKFWPGPEICSGGFGTFQAQDLNAALAGPTRVIRCDEAPWRLLGLSMAGYNALISSGLAALSGLALRKQV